MTPPVRGRCSIPRSKAHFDAVRAAVDKLQADVLDLRNSAVGDLQRSSNQIVWELVVAAIIVVVGGVLLAYLLRRLVTKPVDNLAASVRVVAEGDYAAVIDTSGPPELARLGHDVDEMRQRIVSDLRIVQQAKRVGRGGERDSSNSTRPN